MLVVIDPNVGTTDNVSTKFINMMRAIKAVMTASAGSTPSVVPFASTSGVGSNSTSMITVIANTEAGGWSVGSGDTVPTTTYSASTNYFLDLYVQNTGSSTYPYQKFCMMTGDNKLQSYSFANNNFNTYPVVGVWYGAHTVANLVNGDAFYNSTTQVPSMFYTSAYTAASNSRSVFNPTNGAFMMAVTATYVHFVNLSGTSYSNASLTYGTSGIGGYVASFGLRQLQLWESGSAYAGSSPGVCGSWITCSTDNSCVYYPAAAFFWGQRINKDGTIQSSVKFVNQNAFTSINSGLQQLNPVTGQSMYSSYTASYQYNFDVGAARTALPDYNGYGYRQTSGATVAAPVYMMQSTGYYNNFATPPVSDSTTGALVPPAYPHIYSCVYQDGTNNNMNPGSKMPGIYKSLSAGYPGQSYNMLTFVTLNQTYVVDGDNHFPALTGFSTGVDLFLLRKA
jgi:hypothetical protein